MIEQISFGIRLKKVRELMNMKQTELAKLLGVRSTYISRLETGSSNPSDSLIRLIASATLVNYEWLKNGTGEIKNNLTIEETMSHKSIDFTVSDISIFESIKPQSTEDYATISNMLSYFKMVIQVECSMLEETRINYYRCTEEMLLAISKICTILKLENEKFAIEDKKRFCNEQIEELKQSVERHLSK